MIPTGCRDRFILSGGHALAQYVQLYFSATADSPTILRIPPRRQPPAPRHPEYGLTSGIEMTTGPLWAMQPASAIAAYGERFQRGLLDLRP